MTMGGHWLVSAAILLWAGSLAAGSAEFFIRNRNTKKCIDVSGTPGSSNGANIKSWDCEYHVDNTDQIWKFDDANRLVSVASGKCMDVAGWRSTWIAANIQLWDCGAQDNWHSDHEWEFVYHDAFYFQIRNRDTSKCLDVFGWSSTANGANIQQWFCEPFSDDNSDQWWELVRQDQSC